VSEHFRRANRPVGADQGRLQCQPVPVRASAVTDNRVDPVISRVNGESDLRSVGPAYRCLPGDPAGYCDGGVTDEGGGAAGPV